MLKSVFVYAWHAVLFLVVLAVRDLVFTQPADVSARACVTVAAWIGIVASVVLTIVVWRENRKSTGNSPES